MENVIKYHYGLIDGEFHSLIEIGEILGLSRQRLNQIKLEALRKLTKHATKIELQDYLNIEQPKKL